jgi:hypothetical protein
MIKRIIFIVCSVVLVALPGVIHADAQQQTLEQVVGDKLIRVSYDQEKAGISEPVPFTFDLLTSDESRQISFDSIWISIKSKESNRDLFVSDVIKASSGFTTITYDFPKTGEYTFLIRYKENGSVLAEHLFDFAMSKDTTEIGFDESQQEQGSEVTDASSNTISRYLWVVTLAGGVVLGWFLRFIIFKR